MLENSNYVAGCLNQHLPTDKRNGIVVTSLIRRSRDKTVWKWKQKVQIDTSEKGLISFSRTTRKNYNLPRT